MPITAKGPVWHKKFKQQGIIPRGLRGIDKLADWGYCKAKGWIYGHGAFCLTSFKAPMLGLFQWIKNSTHEAKRMEQEAEKLTNFIKKAFMDSKADSQRIYFNLKRNFKIQLITKPRNYRLKSATRKQMIKETWTKQNRKEFRI